MATGQAFVGCAGWTLPRDVQQAFGPGDSHLQRYATRLNASEINSSFHRPHSQATYRRWADSVPDAFRFSVKLPKAITHERQLRDAQSLLDEFLAQCGALGPRLGCLLVQLAPSTAFDARAAGRFLASLRARWAAYVAFEPRHASWFEKPAQDLLLHHQVARVLADPVRHPAGAFPGGWPGMVYLRLHGTPRTYYSSYDEATIDALGARIAVALRDGCDVWCIFDNTAAGAAAGNALRLRQFLDKEMA